MEKSFQVKFNVQNIVATDNCRIDHISIGQETIGYVAINGDIKKPDADLLVTPFTEAGELPEADCPSCAAKTLFVARTGVPFELVSTSGSVGALFIEAMLESVMRRAN